MGGFDLSVWNHILRTRTDASNGIIVAADPDAADYLDSASTATCTHRIYFDTQEICEQYEARFNETPTERIKGVCQLDQVDIVK